MRSEILSLLVMAGVAAALAACNPHGGGGPNGGVDGAKIAAADTNADWLSYGKGYSEQRYSPLDQINVQTAPKLGLAWFADFDPIAGRRRRRW